MKIDHLIIEPGREEHIAIHGVTRAEVEQVVFGTPVWIRTRQGRYRLLGQTFGGQYLTVILVPRASGVYSLVTARPATDAERRAIRARRRI